MSSTTDNSTTGVGDCLEIFQVDDQVGIGVRTLCDLAAFTCAFKEEPVIVISPLALCSTSQWIYQPTFIGELAFLHPVLQIVCCLCYHHQTPETAFSEFTSQYQLHKSVPRTDEEFAAALFMSLPEFRVQTRWICARFQINSQVSRSALRSLLRLVIQWAFPIHSTFTDQRAAFVLCDWNLLINYLNHSCEPNGFLTWHPTDAKSVQLHTLREIKAGEEITIAYHPYMLWKYMNPFERQVQIFTISQFQCCCALCNKVENIHEFWFPTRLLQATLVRIQMKKTDIDYTLCLYEKCSIRRNMDTKMWLRYHWEFMKMLFGRSRTLSPCDWSVGNIEPYPMVAGAAVERFVRIIMELDPKAIYQVIDTTALIAALHVFQQISTLNWQTSASLHFILHEFEQHSTQAEELQWCVQFRKQFHMQYNIILEGLNVEMITHSHSKDAAVNTRWKRLYTSLLNNI